MTLKSKSVKDAPNGADEVEIDDCSSGDALLVKGVGAMKELEFRELVSIEWEIKKTTTDA